MHKEAHQAACGLTSLGATSKEGAHLQLSSDKTKFAGDGLKTTHIDSGTNEQSRADNILKKIKLEDLSKFLKDTRYAFFTPDSSHDDPIIVTDESEEEEDEDTHVTSHNMPKDTSVAELKTIQWELPLDFLDFLSHVSLFREKLKDLDSLPSLLNKVNETLNMFATVVETTSGATTMDVPSAGQATASPAKGDKNTKDAETNLKDELVYLLGTNVVTQYYNKMLLFDK
nr:hypothetical protein [Tanacetum cinerariifolium]